MEKSLGGKPEAGEHDAAEIDSRQQQAPICASGLQDSPIYQTGVRLTIFVIVVYGYLLLVAALNWLLMRKPKGESPVCFEVMVPARNEAANLPHLIPVLVSQGISVTVLDDNSEDGTADIARSLGAKVIESKEEPPEGWTGKNYACHRLAAASKADWVVFLDADTTPMAGFGPRLAAWLKSTDAKVVTGFAEMAPGRGLEPFYLGWVPWILLATNPFGLVTATGRGHNQFTNGQFSAWRRTTLLEVEPYSKMRSEILEDVKFGRWLAKNKVKVDTLNVSEILRVRMYTNLGEAWRGMSKNSAEIAGSAVGSVVLALFLIFVAWAWTFTNPWLLVTLVSSKFITDRIVKQPIWTFLFAPLTVTMAAATVIASLIKKGQKARTWKGRTYA